MATFLPPPLIPHCTLRPDTHIHPPNSLPQTIEHSLIQSHHATRHILQTHPPPTIQITLPMGRSRRYWYRMSPPSQTLSESAILALHYAQIFRGLHIVLILGTDADKAQRVPWLRILPLDQVPDVTADVVIIAACSRGQQSLVAHAMQRVSAKLVVLFNVAFEVHARGFADVVPVYVCRALDKVAVLKEKHDRPWDVFVETAVFQYEWVGSPVSPWVPSQGNAERFAIARGGERRGGNGYFKTGFGGCEGGFWPFMTVACRQVRPLDGGGLLGGKKEVRERPFGFF